MARQHHSHPISVRDALEGDVQACKTLADRQRGALGFLVQAAFLDSVRRGQLFVAEQDERLVGFVRFNHHIRGIETALYDICVDKDAQLQGVGRKLVQALVKSCREHDRRVIVLRCPEGLPANAFYARLGFDRVSVEPGRRRRLVVWQLSLREA